MKLTEVIEQLQRLLKAEGDLEVLTDSPYQTAGAYRKFKGAEVAYKAILQGRERTPRFHMNYESPTTRGEKVIKL